MDPRNLLRPGTKAYERHAAGEREHYTKVFSQDPDQLFETEPPAWIEIERRTANLIRAATGNEISGHLLSRLLSRPGVSMLSLGSGPGGVELMLAGEAPSATYLCLDFNEALLELGRGRAREQSLPVRFDKADLNDVALPHHEFDLILCHASLHHVVNLEGLAAQVRNALRPGGELMVVDVVARNGYRMWPETRKVVENLWRGLPPRYRINFTAYGEKRLDGRIWDGGTSHEGMECVRSADVLSVLEANFIPRTLVSHQCFSRRFFNSMYGWNYDLSRSLDQALLDWIWELDCYYLSTGQLRGESIFGIYEAKG